VSIVLLQVAFYRTEIRVFLKNYVPWLGEEDSLFVGLGHLDLSSNKNK